MKNKVARFLWLTVYISDVVVIYRKKQSITMYKRKVRNGSKPTTDGNCEHICAH